MSIDYFSNFPSIYYFFNGDESTAIKVPHILRRFKILDFYEKNPDLFDEYFVNDGDRPDLIALKLYDNSYLYWLIYLANSIVNPTDFPKSSYELDRFIEMKYGVGNQFGIHHYVNNAGHVVDATDPQATIVTNIIYEESLNNAKRSIRVLKRKYVDYILREVSNIVQDLDSRKL
jgi:hypothetical protein